MAVPLRGEPRDVAGELLLAGPLGGRAHDDAGVLGDDCLAGSFFSRVRSVSGSLRLMPVIEPSGTYTRKRPGSEIWLVSRAPLCPIGSLVTWTSTESPDLSADSMRRGWPSSPAASQLTSPAYSTALRPRPMSTNAASMLGSTFCTLPR